jgi:hypothetical protein
MGIIRRSLDNGHFTASDRVMKVSGRYFVKNIEAILDDVVEFNGHDIVSSFFQRNWASSECFCASPRFLRKFLLPLQDEIDDSRGESFERILARAIRGATDAGFTHASFHQSPQLTGISGTYNLPVGLSIVVVRWASKLRRLIR